MIAIEEALSQRCEVGIYPKDGKTKETLMREYIKALKALGECELQRKESLKATKKLKQLYKK